MSQDRPDAQLTHLGLFVRDMEAMVAFYTRVLGLLVTDVGELNGRRLTFLSRNPAEHHQMVLASGRGDEPTTINQLSFRLKSLSDLKRFHALLTEAGIALDPVNHGAAWSVYFRDPEDNRIELYTDSDWYVTQPMRAPVDLTASEAEIRAATLALIGGDPSFRPLSQWAAEMQAKLEP
jgi:catechol-2,3-dioxygenase